MSKDAALLAQQIFDQSDPDATLAELLERVDHLLTDDPDDLISDVKQRLTKLHAARTGLTNLLDHAEAAETKVDAPHPGAVMPGALLKGRYKLLERISDDTNKMGEVWRAEDLNSDSRIVAVKLLKTGFSTEGNLEALKRFDREAAALKAVRSSYVVKYLDSGAAPDDRPFIVMEFVKGKHLDVAAESMTLWEIVELMAKICDGVALAQTCGVVHRDLKFANILVDDDGTPKILDFGLAVCFEGIHRESEGMTDTNVWGGSWSFASPEQAVSLAAASASSDVYSLGIILFRLIAPGHFPYGKPDISLAELRHRDREAIRAEKLPPTLAGGVPSDVLLSDIVVKCLELSPKKRYDWAGRLFDDLRLWLNDHARANGKSIWYIEASPGSIHHRTRQRRRLVSALGLAVAFAILSAFLYRSVQQARVNLKQANANLEQARIADDRAGAATLMFVEMIQDANPFESLRLSPDDAAAKSERAHAAWKEFGSRIGRAKWIVAHELASLWLAQGKFEQAVEMFNQVTLATQGPDSADPRLRAAAYLGKGIALTSLDRRAEARVALNTALTQTQAARHTPSELASCREAIGWLDLDEEQFSDAENQLISAIQGYSVAPANERGIFAATIGLGRIAQTFGKSVTEELYTDAVNGLTRLQGIDHPETLGARHALLAFRLERAINKVAPGEIYLEEAEAIFKAYERRLGTLHDHTASSCKVFARAISYQHSNPKAVEKYPAAEALLTRIIEARKAAGIRSVSVDAGLLAGRANDRTLRRDPRAIGDFQEVSAIIGLIDGLKSSRYAEARSNLGAAMALLGRSCEAIPVLREAVKLRANAPGAEPLAPRQTTLHLAIALRDCSARDALEAVDILEDLVGSDQDSDLDAPARMAVKELPLTCEKAGLKEKALAWNQRWEKLHEFMSSEREATAPSGSTPTSPSPASP